jgi:serine/threonine protein kinase
MKYQLSIIFLFFMKISSESLSCSEVIESLPNYQCIQEKSIDKGAKGTIYMIESKLEPSSETNQYILKHQKKDKGSKKELEILKTMKGSSYIVQLHDWIETDDEAFFVQSYASKGNLREYILNSNGFTFGFVVDFFKKLMTGIKNMHDRGIIHADLKTENVVIDKDLNPVIIDFDLSVDKGTMNRPRGTPECMAPEVMRKFVQHEKVLFNEKVDLYSLSVMFYEMFVRIQPYYLPSIDYNMLMQKEIKFQKDMPIDFFTFISLGIMTESHRTSYKESFKFLNSIDLKSSNYLAKNVSYQMISFAEEDEKLLPIESSYGTKIILISALFMFSAFFIGFGLFIVSLKKKSLSNNQLSLTNEYSINEEDQEDEIEEISIEINLNKHIKQKEIN